jgi:hypothetical protein
MEGDASTFFGSDLMDSDWECELPKSHPPTDVRSWATARFEKMIVVKASKALENR